MSWVSAETIKLHLQALTIDALTIRFTPLRFHMGEEVQLPHAPLTEGSFAVYAMLEKKPAGPISISFSGTGWISLGVGAIAPGEVVLGDNHLLEHRYCEGVDFLVDEAQGQVKRLADGSIPLGASIKAWCMPLTTFVENVDYKVDYAAGLLIGLPEGSISEEAWLLISYSTSAIGATDSLIGKVIQEAEAKIEDRLKDGYDSTSSEEGLTIGATELTLSLLCDDLALRSLTGVGDASADDRARRFLELSHRFEERAISTLSKFIRLPLPSVSTRQSNTPLPSGW